MPEASVIIVGNDPERVEADLAGGAMTCPCCGGLLAPWSFARRRTLRTEAGPVALRPRRGRCCSCRSTHVLLPDVALLRRVDAVAVIGRAAVSAAGGEGHRRVAERVGRPASTVRGWPGRLRSRAALIATHFSSWAARPDPNLGPIATTGSPLADAIEAVRGRLRSRPPPGR